MDVATKATAICAPPSQWSSALPPRCLLSMPSTTARTPHLREHDTGVFDTRRTGAASCSASHLVGRSEPGSSSLVCSCVFSLPSRFSWRLLLGWVAREQPLTRWPRPLTRKRRRRDETVRCTLQLPRQPTPSFSILPLEDTPLRISCSWCPPPWLRIGVATPPPSSVASHSPTMGPSMGRPSPDESRENRRGSSNVNATATPVLLGGPGAPRTPGGGSGGGPELLTSAAADTR
jgi:hypothetical protein